MGKANVVIGGDLNFILGMAKIWGPKATLDPLSNFFSQHLAQKGIFYLEPTKLNSTWWNMCVGEDRIANRLDHFLIGEDVVSSTL